MTETESATLIDFLLARIAEDEAVAQGATDPDRPGTHWQWAIPDDVGDPDAPRWLRTAEEFPTTSGVGSLPAFPLGFEFKAEPSRGMAHIARHDPARVLAECAARRAIVEEFAPARNGFSRLFALLALPYADHEDFRDEWRA